MMTMSLPVQVFFLSLGDAFHLAEGRWAGTRIGLVGEEVVEDDGGL